MMSDWLFGTIQLLWWPRRHCLAAAGRWPRARPDKTAWFLPIFWFVILWPFEIRLLRHIPNDGVTIILEDLLDEATLPLVHETEAADGFLAV